MFILAIIFISGALYILDKNNDARSKKSELRHKKSELRHKEWMREMKYHDSLIIQNTKAVQSTDSTFQRIYFKKW